MNQHSNSTCKSSTYILAIVALAALWGLVIWFVNPTGEFMINDDWSFVKIVEAIDQGKVIPTGWGPGGPSAIVHVLWGKLFTSIAGFSLTNLRLSVLLVGFLAMPVLVILLARNNTAPAITFLAALVILSNPLFMALSFTFMTDITFAALLIISLLFIDIGVQKQKTTVLSIGLFFALLSILTRQIGIIIPLGLLATLFIHPLCKKMGIVKIVLLTIAIVFIPWFGFEFFLSRVGSTPLTKHQVIADIFGIPMSKGFWGYLEYLLMLMGLIGIGYTAIFVTPLTAAVYSEIKSNRPLLTALAIVTFGFVVVQAILFLNIVDFPTPFHRNIIFNFGIGPILLKDTYLLNIQRTFALPPYLYYSLAYVGAVSALVLLFRVGAYLRHIFSSLFKKMEFTYPFISLLTFTSAILYWLIIGITWFFDRYLIPLIILTTIWLTVTYLSGKSIKGRRPIIAGLITVFLIGTISVVMVHDFMETKRTIMKAQNFVMNDLRTKPCDFDGGFEFTGYNCYQKDYKPRDGISWWWVNNEKYVITMGPLPNYEVIHTFPINRLMEKDAAIYVLKPKDGEAVSRNGDSDGKRISVAGFDQ